MDGETMNQSEEHIKIAKQKPYKKQQQMQHIKIKILFLYFA
jgi:hypothetical protein